MVEQNKPVRSRDEQIGAIANDWIAEGMGPDIAHERSAQMILEAEARGAAEQRRKDGEGSWHPMSDAPRNRTPILVKTVPALERKGDRWSGWANRYLVVQHEGVLDSGFDMGWSVACPVGYGGFSDDWFVGWKPVDYPAIDAAMNAESIPHAPDPRRERLARAMTTNFIPAWEDMNENTRKLHLAEADRLLAAIDKAD